jgi:D-tyrosyl-tRNA(Tyr) deacylase
MRAVIQRVSSASVVIEGRTHSFIRQGLLILAGFEEADVEEDLSWMAAKIINMRIFADEAGLMNLSIKDIQGELLCVSQFTLHALTKKGNRPSFIKAAKPERAIPLYERFLMLLSEVAERKVETGVFGADMKVSLTNDGPVTIVIDSKNRE